MYNGQSSIHIMMYTIMLMLKCVKHPIKLFAFQIRNVIETMHLPKVNEHGILLTQTVVFHLYLI